MTQIIDRENELVLGHGQTRFIGSVEAAHDFAGKIVSWKPASELPVEGQMVLLALDSGEVWTGYLSDDGLWKYPNADPVSEQVKFWMEYPPAP